VRICPPDPGNPDAALSRGWPDWTYENGPPCHGTACTCKGGRRRANRARGDKTAQPVVAGSARPCSGRAGGAGACSSKCPRQTPKRGHQAGNRTGEPGDAAGFPLAGLSRAMREGNPTRRFLVIGAMSDGPGAGHPEPWPALTWTDGRPGAMSL